MPTKLPPASPVAVALAALQAAGLLRGQPTLRPAAVHSSYLTGWCRAGTHVRCPGLVFARLDPATGRSRPLACVCTCKHPGQVGL